MHLFWIYRLSICLSITVSLSKTTNVEETTNRDSAIDSNKTTHTDKNIYQDSDDVRSPDPNGYIIYCPCMGRFGNQADHFLGSLGFAKKINRTLVLPPWRTYKNIPFNEWFQVEAVQQYHRAITAEDFMNDFASVVWPVGKRTGWCWLPLKRDNSNNYCGMKDGNPFGPFWDGLGINFDSHIVYGFSYDEISKWKKEYPGDKYPVIALKGAPASFPVKEEYVPLQYYLKWSHALEKEANAYIMEHFHSKKFVGIHLRNGPDWVNACEHAAGTHSFMATPQCLGYSDEHTVTKELCLPSNESILSLTKKILNSTGATILYVATDKDPMIVQLQSYLGQNVKILHHDPWLPQIDLIILGKSDHFIGNCVSSFTSFVARERLINKKPTSYWTFTK